MKISNKLRRTLSAALVLTAAGMLTLGGCTKVDDTLGSNLVPEDQQMKTGYISLPGLKEQSPENYVRTRLFQTDSIKASNIGSGYFGAMQSDTFGLRTAGFMSQYVSYYKIDNNFFGYKPFLDSVQLLLSIKSFGTDTLTHLDFEVYEITDNKYLTDKKDTLFYLNFSPEDAGVISEKPLFTFWMGKEGDVVRGPATKAVRMEPTEEGETFIKRLMLQPIEGEPKWKYEGDYSIYSVDSLKYFVEEFKGLYIKPTQATADRLSKQGTIFGTELDASGFAVYGRNRVESDPSMVKDTIGMVYYFYDSYAKHGNVSVNTVKNYYNGLFSEDEVKESNPNRQPYPTALVAGLGGVVTEITFGKEFFDALDNEIEKVNTETGKQFRTLAFSQARMSIYIWGSSYNWAVMPDMVHLVEQMNNSQKRLGLYTNYKQIDYKVDGYEYFGQQAITDYAYSYEANYGTELAYGGYINRSQGCYAMDISAYMQELWNSYLKEKERAAKASEAVNLDNVEKRSIYLGPEAYSLFTPTTSAAMGMTGMGLDGEENKYPIRFDLTYNMIK